MPEVSETDLESFRAALDGEATAPGDPGWDAARRPWNLVADQRPALVVFAEGAGDAAATLRFAREQGLRVAPQSTGHGAGPMPDLADAVLLRLSRMSAVSVDAGSKTARVEAGAQWNDVVGLAAEHGLAALHGSSGTVGVAGFTLGGGLGWLGRSHGFACNKVAAIEAVTADGETRRIGPDVDPELFWALRGGGGGHAVVTALEIELVELQAAYAGALMWPIEQAAAVTQAWREWTGTVPDELTSTIKLIRFPPLPEVPEPLRGRALTAVTFAFTGSEAEGVELLAPLRDVAEPYLDMTSTVPAPALASIAGDPTDPLAGRTAGVLLSALEEGTVEAFVELAGPDGDLPLIFLELRHLGGALDRSDPGHGALDVAGAPYLLCGIGAVMEPADDELVEAALARVRERLAPWTAERTLLGFAEQQGGTSESFPDDAAARLANLKATYDPDGLIVTNHTAD